MGCSEKDFGNPNTWGIVCNSHSRKVLKRWEQVRPYVEEKGVVYEFFASDGKEEIGQKARDLCQQGCKTLVVIGSDGTLNDVINGVLSLPLLP